MDVVLRPAVPGDAAGCGQALYAAFTAIAAEHRFPPDFPGVEAAIGVAEMLIGHAGVYGVVAERAGTIVGSIFMDERAPVCGIGPVSVDPAAQNRGVGRRLMQDTLDRAAGSHAAGVRLVQAAYHNRSLCLYAGLGFRMREALSVMQGPALGVSFAGYEVRAAAAGDVAACNALCRDVHGFDRDADLREAIGRTSAVVVEQFGAVAGYATSVGFFGHAVARENRALMALIGAATEFDGPGFLLPTRNHELFTWCLANGLRLVMQMTLMTIGLYSEPAGACLPSILY